MRPRGPWQRHSQVFSHCSPKQDLHCSEPGMVITQQAADSVSLHLLLIAVFSPYFRLVFTCGPLVHHKVTTGLFGGVVVGFFWLLGAQLRQVSRGMKLYDYYRHWALSSSTHTIPLCWACSPCSPGTCSFWSDISMARVKLDLKFSDPFCGLRWPQNIDFFSGSGLASCLWY